VWGQKRHQPVRRRKEKQTEKNVCRLRITGAGLWMFEGKSVRVLTVLQKLPAWTGRQGVSMLRFSEFLIQTLHDGGLRR
jgi:hypothetical protein